jgi:hypothetical protein
MLVYLLFGKLTKFVGNVYGLKKVIVIQIGNPVGWTFVGTSPSTISQTGNPPSI